MTRPARPAARSGRLAAAVALAGLLAACGPAASPAPSPSPSPSPSPTGAVDLARDLATRFEHARAAGEWADAWALLAPRTQAELGTVEAWSLQEIAYNAEGGNAFIVTEPSADPGLVDQLLGADRSAIAAEADLARSSVVLVTHPAISDTARATRAYLAAPLVVGGEWRLWQLLP